MIDKLTDYKWCGSLMTLFSLLFVFNVTSFRNNTGREHDYMAIALELSERELRVFDIVEGGAYDFHVIDCVERTRDFELHLQVSDFKGNLFLLRDQLTMTPKAFWKFKNFWVSVKHPHIIRKREWEASDFLGKRGRLLTKVVNFNGNRKSDVSNYLY